MNEKPLRIRDLTKDDIPKCHTIVCEHWGAEVAEQAADEMSEMFVEQQWPPHYLVVEDGDEIVAFAGFRQSLIMSGVFELIWINVRSDYAGRGIGKILTAERIKEITKRNGSMIMLMTQKPSFFETQGFQVATDIDGWKLMIHRIRPLVLGRG